MNHSSLRRRIEAAKIAAQQASNRVHDLVGSPRDPQLVLYLSHTRADFEKMRQRYGAEETMRYINEMEKRLLVHKKG